MILLLGILLFFVLPSPWAYVAVVLGILIEPLDLLFWWRKVRHLHVKTGAETLIGRTAEVRTACRPVGQVAVAGELWQARCEAGANVGETVTIVGRDDLLLIVELAGAEPLPKAAPAPPRGAQ